MKPIHELLNQQQVQCVGKDQSVLEVARRMTEWNVGAVGILDGERLVGIFSERDLLNRVVSRGLSPAETRVEQVMTPNPVVVDADSTVEHCIRVMNQAKCRHLPVVTEGKLVGMISMRDLLLYNLEQKDSEIELMRAFIHYVPPSMPTDSGR
ncbi:MAG: CBS domain-containing protein [Acidobacteria bacterium]|nr:CBS domain-containing protein [Acidobacteriota bacterium]